MRTKIMGFEQDKAIEYDIDLIDICIIEYVRYVKNNTYFEKIYNNEKTWVWITAKKVSEDLPMLKLKERTIWTRLDDLCKKGLLEKVSKCTIPNSKVKKTFYSTTTKADNNSILFGDDKSILDNDIPY